MKPAYVQKFVLVPLALLLFLAAAYEAIQSGPGARGERITNLIPALESAIEQEDWARAEKLALEIERLWDSVETYVLFNNRRMDTDTFKRALVQAQAGIRVKDAPTALSNARLLQQVWSDLDEF